MMKPIKQTGERAPMAAEKKAAEKKAAEKKAAKPMKLLNSLVTALFAFVTLVSLLVMVPVAAFAEPDTTIVDLSKAPQHEGKQNVVVRGEVVGDILTAGRGHKWLLVQDGGATISVYVKDEDAQKITHLGRYSQIGTQIEVSGEFKVDCDDHDGLTDIHATSITVLDEGRGLASPFDVNKLRIGALLVLIGCGVVVLQWRLRERTR